VEDVMTVAQNTAVSGKWQN